MLAKIGQVRDSAAERLGARWSHAQFEAQLIQTEQLLAEGQYPAAYNAATTLLQQARKAGTQAYEDADYDLAMACILMARVLQMTGNAASALPLLGEARKGFAAIATTCDSKAAAGMAVRCLTEQGDCLRALGRLDEAAAAYQENISLAEQLDDECQVAVGKGQLGTVFLYQRRYPQALTAFEQARDLFAKRKDLAGVATEWHQIGMTHQMSGKAEAAEAAYQEAYRLRVLLGDVAVQADTLGQLGNLYSDALNSPEQAVQFYRQAEGIYQQLGDKAKESWTLSNLAETLRELRRYNEARHAIHQAIICKADFGHAAESWKSWHILAKIETDCGNLATASTAKQKAIAAYLAYRRDGGENHNTEGRIAHAVRQTLSTDGTAATITLLEDCLAYPEWQDFQTYLNTLIAVLNGNHDPSLADAPDLNYSMAAEILLLIES